MSGTEASADGYDPDEHVLERVETHLEYLLQEAAGRMVWPDEQVRDLERDLEEFREFKRAVDADRERPMLDVCSGPPFEGWDCPCGAPQPDGSQLYCDDCFEQMARDLVEELEQEADR